MKSKYYDQALLEHSLHPKHEGRLSRPTHADVATNESCGDEISLTLKVEGQKVIDAKWTGTGCAISKAAADILCDILLGKPEEEKIILRLTEKLPGRTRCTDVPTKALAAIVSNDPELAPIVDKLLDTDLEY